LKLTCFISAHSLALLGIHYEQDTSLLQALDAISSVASFLPAVIAAIDGAPPISIPLSIPGFEPLSVAKLAGEYSDVRLYGDDIHFPVLELTSASFLVDAQGIYVMGTLDIKSPSSLVDKAIPGGYTLEVPVVQYQGKCAATEPSNSAVNDESAAFQSFRSAFLAKTSITDCTSVQVSVEKSKLADVLNKGYGTIYYLR